MLQCKEIFVIAFGLHSSKTVLIFPFNVKKTAVLIKLLIQVEKQLMRIKIRGQNCKVQSSINHKLKALE